MLDLEVKVYQQRRSMIWPSRSSHLSVIFTRCKHYLSLFMSQRSDVKDEPGVADDLGFELFVLMVTITVSWDKFNARN